MFFRCSDLTRILFLLLTGFIFLPSVTLYGSAYKEDPLDLVNGRDLYEKNCMVCHGEDGNGKTFTRHAVRVLPADFKDKERMKDVTPERMKRSIYYGRLETAMISWRYDLTEWQINDIIAYIRYVFMDENINDLWEKLKDPIEEGTPLPWTKDKKRRYSRGKKRYETFCYHCHGLKGDGKMPVREALIYAPRNFTDPIVAETLDANQMFYMIKNGRSGTAMVSWKKEMSDEEIGDVIYYIRKEFMKVGEEGL